ncbi:MAG: hypothetical protein AAB152_06110 [Candidatus Coatesbacteria bacterium]
MKILRWLPVLLLAACTPGVQVRHPVAPLRLDPADLPRIGRLAVILRVSSASAARASAGVGQAAVGQFLNALTESRDPNRKTIQLSPASANDALRLSAARLASPWTRVVCYAVQGPSTTEFLVAAAPGAVLWVDAGDVEAAQAERVVESKNRKGEVTRTTVWDAGATWRVGWQLGRWPEGGTMASGVETSSSGDSYRSPVDLDEWTAQAAGWRAAWADAVKAQLLPRATWRWRRTWKDKDVRADSAGCYAAWNEGVRAEQAGNWPAAQGAYRRALAAARTDKDRGALNGYLSELSLVFGGGPGAGSAADAWFDEPVAVVPFANDTNNVGAPDVARAMVQKELLARGYRVLSIADVDGRLHGIGISQGEHLRAFSADKIAAALGTRRWITGRVDEFKVINVGVYYRRQARVTLGLGDAGGRTVWEAAGVSVRQSAGTKDIGARLLGGLAGSLIEKATKTYLKEDTEAAVAEAMAYLPSR